MTAKPKLSIVPPEPSAPYDESKGLKDIERARARLLSLALRHVRHGTLKSIAERIHEASDLSGIPRRLLEVKK